MSKGCVVVVDDDEAVRDALSMLFNASGLGVKSFSSASAFLRAELPDGPACLVLDVRMPGVTGLELQEELVKRRASLPVIFLTGHGDVPMAVRAMKKGAYDFIEKPIDSRRLLLAVLGALQSGSGRRNRAPVFIRDDPGGKGPLSELSAREREVLDRVVEGLQTRQIANELNISIKTVEFHRSRIREKLGVKTIAELVRRVLEEGEDQD